MFTYSHQLHIHAKNYTDTMAYKNWPTTSPKNLTFDMHPQVTEYTEEIDLSAVRIRENRSFSTRLTELKEIEETEEEGDGPGFDSGHGGNYGGNRNLYHQHVTRPNNYSRFKVSTTCKVDSCCIFCERYLSPKEILHKARSSM